jgi:hypothetical protein
MRISALEYKIRYRFLPNFFSKAFSELLPNTKIVFEIMQTTSNDIRYSPRKVAEYHNFSTIERKILEKISPKNNISSQGHMEHSEFCS